jgi:hypothetical protein
MRQRGLVVILTVAVAACGGGDGSSNPLATTSTVPGATTVTTSAPTTTTLPPTTTTTVDPFLFDIFSIEPTPPSEPATGVNALVGGAPDEVAALLLSAGLEDGGIDLTGVTVMVWPISGTGESFVIVEFDESASLFAEDDDVAQQLFAVLLAHPVIDDQNITRLAMRISGTDEQGAFVFTFTARVDDLRTSLASGEDLPEGSAHFGLELVEP